MNGNTAVTPRKNKRGKFNVIDFLLIVVILFIIVVLVYVFLPNSWVRGLLADNSVNIQYAIEFQGVDDQFVDNIKEQDVVLDSVSKNKIGTVTAIDYSNLHRELTEDGTYVVIPNKHNVIVTVTANADYNSGIGYDIGGTRIAVGEKIDARFPNFVGTGYCISFSAE